MAQTAGTEDDGAGPRRQHRLRLLDRVIRRQAGIGQGSDIGRLQLRVDLDNCAGTGLQILGEPAVGEEPRKIPVSGNACPRPLGRPDTARR